MSYQHAQYSAKWWNLSEVPDPQNPWGAWQKLNDCESSSAEGELPNQPAPSEYVLSPDDAQLVGSANLSGDTINLATGEAVWHVKVETAGQYQVEFDYTSPYGTKTNRFYAGEQSQSVTTPQSELTETVMFEVNLTAGEHKLGVDGGNGSWGYIFLSQARVSLKQSGITPPTNPPTEPPVNPPEEGEYPGTVVTDSTRENYADYADTIDNVSPQYYLTQDDQTKVLGNYGNIYDAGLYDKGYGEDVGIAWAGWNPYHYLGNKAHKMALIDEYNIQRVSFIPTYFIATYEEGIRYNDTRNTLSVAQQAQIIKELIDKGVRINYRPHIDPIKFSWDGASPNMDPGYLDWRGLFDELDPMAADYRGVIDQGLAVIKQALQNAQAPLKEPVRFDLGAELMMSTKQFPHRWHQLALAVREQIEADPLLRDNVVLGHNFSHHVQYLVELENHPEYFTRIVSGDSFVNYPHLLFVDDMTQQQRADLASYIKALDTVTVSQYMPMDVTKPILDNTVIDIETTATDVKDALMIHEQNFIQKVLMGKLGIAKQDLPVFHLGEYGMGIKGLITPNVWDSNAVTDEEKISFDVHQRHAQIAIDGLLEYMQHSQSAAKSLIIWVSGAPYDVIGFYKGDGQGMDTGDEGHGYPGKSPFNPQAAASLKAYWK
ncbi:hypothetical protein HGP28_02020 [Vibrio sp. SM6]|uniref:CBM6 domain-containing protein n=1 Tax=Vibrio agarilyticus TaxID=2726741 RepID=A0A7X8YFL9_9VIBR|nr:hypothetical protein [Vibrio agarilyticus]